MNRIQLGISCLATIGLAAVQPASAQVTAPAAQTPQNAQKFLQLVFGQGSTTTSVDNLQVRKDMDSGWNCNGGSYTCYWTTSRSGKVAWVSGEGCVTNIVVYITETSWRYDHAYHTITNGAPRVAIAWGQVSDVKVNGSVVSLAGFAGTGSFYFATADTAARAGRAMKVLQTACDPTRGTGF